MRSNLDPLGVSEYLRGHFQGTVFLSSCCLQSSHGWWHVHINN